MTQPINLESDKLASTAFQFITARSLLFLILAAVPANAEFRKWTDDQGREVQAEFVELEKGDIVRLKLKSGQQAKFPLTKLSLECRDYVERITSDDHDDPKAASDAKVPNFESPWPKQAGLTDDPEIEVIDENAETKKFIYESANFRFVSDSRLVPTAVRQFAILFEATHSYCNAIPVGLGEGDRTDGKYLIKLFEQRDDYYAAGAAGFPGSAGLFMGNDNKMIIVPFDALGLRKVGSGYTIDRSKFSRILPHEITHQLTPVPYLGLTRINAWFAEGLAEYISTTPYKSGKYDLRNHRKEIVDFVTGYSDSDKRGRVLGKEIELGPLKEFMAFGIENYGGDEKADRCYGGALLIVYYFMHLDGEGDAARLKAYCKALLKGESLEISEELLLDGRTYEKLEEDIIKQWRRDGISLTFSSKNDPKE